jgi:hypothetical protein
MDIPFSQYHLSLRDRLGFKYVFGVFVENQIAVAVGAYL